MALEVLDFELPPIGTNAFVVVDRERAACVVVDAPLNAFSTVESLLVRNGWTLEGLLLTHGHWDHTLDGHRFAAFGARIFGHEADRILFSEPQVMNAFAMPGIEMHPVAVTDWVKQGDCIELLGRTVEAREVPGHCPGSLLFWFKDAGIAFPGDAVFRGSVGRYDLPGGDFAALEASIRRQIYTLPDETRLYPGHGPPTTVAHERANNPFVRG